jgi:DNA repair protein RecN (Recombination protein N)
MPRRNPWHFFEPQALSVIGQRAGGDAEPTWPETRETNRAILRATLPMLAELRLENYVVVDHAAVQFAPGLNLLTGETGAGKSILIDALSLLLGEKASAEVIRTGAERAVVSAVFELEGWAQKHVVGLLEQNGIDPEADSVILRREIAAGGKGRVFVNNQPATVGVLKAISPYLATVHGQNEALMSFDASTRLALLDSFSGAQTEAVADSFAGWKGIRGRILELQHDEQDRLRLVDLWTYQRREIEESKLERGEDEGLETEKRVLANSEKIYTAAMNAFDLLYEGEKSTSSSLRAAQKQLEELARFEPKFNDALAVLDSARIGVEDVGGLLRDYAGGIHASPERLAQIEDRLALLDRLKRKYGPTLDDVIKFGEQVAQKLSELENKDEVLRALNQDLARAASEYLGLARSLSKKRREAAHRLEKLVEAEINDLAMKASFRIQIESSEGQENWTSSGFDQVRYLISPNPGEPLKPVEQTASGGELSRVMLALKSSVEAGSGQGRKKNSGAQRTMVFDEIDSGIGGRAAEAVGKKLKGLSRINQVLCITHLPQIATFADHHYLIEKRDSGGRSKTTVRPITGQERTDEIARMLSGARLTETSRKHAEQMLKTNA